jgi:hypothetical protein
MHLAPALGPAARAADGVDKDEAATGQGPGRLHKSYNYMIIGGHVSVASTKTRQRPDRVLTGYINHIKIIIYLYDYRRPCISGLDQDEAATGQGPGRLYRLYRLDYLVPLLQALHS